ncbi:hypothetical protein TNCT_356841 [Trichonephila clavata]|uniref:Uncharacterized protein n=1 Tax=Trichonephila clavata TaxID=2740835 RepID=A0A8X6K6T8_TRICU|nr:hypothetical protein TNCT_356841 [Trichonephila clavata]
MQHEGKKKREMGQNSYKKSNPKVDFDLNTTAGVGTCPSRYRNLLRGGYGLDLLDSSCLLLIMRWTRTGPSGLGLPVTGCRCASLRTGTGPSGQGLSFINCLSLGHLPCLWTRWKGLWHLPLPPFVTPFGSSLDFHFFL